MLLPQTITENAIEMIKHCTQNISFSLYGGYAVLTNTPLESMAPKSPAIREAVSPSGENSLARGFAPQRMKSLRKVQCQPVLGEGQVDLETAKGH